MGDTEVRRISRTDSRILLAMFTKTFITDFDLATLLEHIDLHLIRSILYYL